jgi:adenosylcobinamide kinase/adenosylcobinamide-phosphate guanylyltransferase
MASRTDRPVRYVATATADDEEMAARIAHHRRHRPPGWTVVEAPIEVEDAVRSAAAGETIILDCVTLWISNLMVDNEDDMILAQVDEAIDACRLHSGRIMVVSNEVGSGIVPMDPVGRRFRDLQGMANQRFATAAETAYLVVAGKALRLGEADDVR